MSVSDQDLVFASAEPSLASSLLVLESISIGLNAGYNAMEFPHTSSRQRPNPPGFVSWPFHVSRQSNHTLRAA
jgi:hypothetical protein